MKSYEIVIMCMRYGFYTHGSVDAYNTLQKNVDKGIWCLDDVAADIWAHSDKDVLAKLHIYRMRDMMDFINKEIK